MGCSSRREAARRSAHRCQCDGSRRPVEPRTTRCRPHSWSPRARLGRRPQHHWRRRQTREALALDHRMPWTTLAAGPRTWPCASRHKTARSWGWRARCTHRTCNTKTTSRRSRRRWRGRSGRGAPTCAGSHACHSAPGGNGGTTCSRPRSGMSRMGPSSQHEARRCNSHRCRCGGNPPPAGPRTIRRCRWRSPGRWASPRSMSGTWRRRPCREGYRPAMGSCHRSRPESPKHRPSRV
mmetsp:Transcript_39274/g.113548  ORF Transcript_39274/g.113548 Transcript_39274/m.113548 type:complete len:237 (+) Transcript_39274:455-1165(+)